MHTGNTRGTTAAHNGGGTSITNNTADIASYNQAVAYCESLLHPHTEQLGGKLLPLHFERMGYFLAQLGHPEKRFRTVHVAGTSGKGSTTTMIGAILQAAGMRTGVHCTPYLQTPAERLQVDGLNASPAEFARLVDEMRPAIRHMQRQSPFRDISYREIAVAQAFRYFAQSAVEIAAVETGMGGRFDYTNHIQPLVSAIVTVDYDHLATLGPTLANIAWHKAGIIKQGVPVVSGVSQQIACQVIEEEAALKRSPLARLGREITYHVHSVTANGSVFDYSSSHGPMPGLEIGLLGRHQVLNASVAVGVVEYLREAGLPISDEAIRSGLRQARMPGRLEIVQREPTVVLDGAHNPEKMHSLAVALHDIFQDRPPILVVGVLAAKQVDEILAEVVPLARRVVVTSPTVRDKPAVALDRLAATCRRLGGDVVVEPDERSAVERAKDLAGKDGLVCVTGSLYMVGQVREMWIPAAAIISQRTSFPSMSG